MTNKVREELLRNYKNPEDLLGQEGVWSVTIFSQFKRLGFS